MRATYCIYLISLKIILHYCDVCDYSIICTEINFYIYYIYFTNNILSYVHFSLCPQKKSVCLR